INSTEVISQILEKMKTSVKADMTEVKILLRPEHLGEVSLKIATHNGFVTAQFTAENQKVKEIIESNFNQLKDMLNEQGINVGALEVNISDKGQGQETFNQFENTQEKSSKRMEEIVGKSFDEEAEQKEEKVKLDNSQIDYTI
ncbi:MAG: flagellar hook-length control protein FliK, partial [Eubacteriales bacterium]|nr:flagellar hook-length control protein FliK [Eubacteriales bacterium]